MIISSVTASAFSSMMGNQQIPARSSPAIAVTSVNDRFVTAIVDLKMAKHSLQANAAVMNAADHAYGQLVDILV